MRDFGLPAHFVSACIVTVVVGLAWEVVRAGVAREIARRWWPGLLALALGLVHQWRFVRPAFVHAELRGPALVTDLLRFATDAPRFHYGPSQYLVLGGLARLIEPSVEGVICANRIVFGAAGIAFAALAGRLFRSERANFYAAVLFASSPLMSRLAASEDAHGVGLLFGLIAAIHADRAIRDGERISIAIAAASSVVMLATREAFYGWIPMLLLIALRGPGGGRASRHAAACIATACIAYLALAVAAGTGRGGIQLWLSTFVLMLTRPSYIGTSIAMNPICDLPGPGTLLLVLGALGAAALASRRDEPRAALAIGFAGMSVLTINVTWPSLGALWGFRLGFYAIFLLVAVRGVLRLEEVTSAKLGSRAWGAPVVLAVALLGVFGGAARANRSSNAEYVDYVWLRDALVAERRRTPNLALVGLEPREPGPQYVTSREVPRVLGIPSQSVEMFVESPPGPYWTWMFHEGLGCSVFTVFELLRPGAPDAGEFLRDPALLGLIFFEDDAGFGRSRVHAPRVLRDECRAMSSTFPRVVREGQPVRVDDDPPCVVAVGAQRFSPRLRAAR